MCAYMMRLRRHSVSLDRYNTAKQIILERLRKAGIDHAFVSRVDAATVHTFSGNLPACLMPAPNELMSKSVWLTLPFHPVYCNAVNAVLHDFSDHRTTSILQSNICQSLDSLRAAWQLKMPALGTIVRRY